jgi:hypothetical protein
MNPGDDPGAGADPSSDVDPGREEEILAPPGVGPGARPQRGAVPEAEPVVDPGDYTNAYRGGDTSSLVRRSDSATTSAGKPSDYGTTWDFLTNTRLLKASDTPFEDTFEKPEACNRIITDFFSQLLNHRGSGCNIRHDDKNLKQLKGVFNVKGKELDFSKELFKRLGVAVHGCLEPGGREKGKGIVDIVPDKMIVIRCDPPAQVTDRDGMQIELAMGLAREVNIKPDSTSTHGTASIPDHAFVIFERPVLEPGVGGGQALSSAEARGGQTDVGGPRLSGAATTTQCDETDDGGGKMPAVQAAAVRTDETPVRGDEMRDAAAPPRDDEARGDTASAAARHAGTGRRRGVAAAAAAVVIAPPHRSKRGVRRLREPRRGRESDSGQLVGRSLRRRVAAAGAQAIDAGADQGSAGKEPRTWRVRHILAVVDLKSEVNACAAFERADPPIPPIIPAASIYASGNAHGALGQALMYSLSHALRGWAAIGAHPTDFKLLTAVVVCKSAKGPSGKRSHWALAHLTIPEECGGCFRFGVRASESTSHSNFVTASLALYLSVMADSLKAAMTWLKAIKETGRRPPPVLMSGRAVKFGIELNRPIDLSPSDGSKMELVATPVAECGRGFQISQGELLRATLNLDQLTGREAIFKAPNASRCAEALVKVTSIPCFNLLVTNSVSYLVELSQQTNLADEIEQVLAKSLYAVYQTMDGTGLIQILPDLRRLGFEPLRPKHFMENMGYTWDTIWTAFENFATHDLIPLAKAGIVHADIRPGAFGTRPGSRSKNKVQRLRGSVCRASFEQVFVLSEEVHRSALTHMFFSLIVFLLLLPRLLLLRARLR